MAMMEVMLMQTELFSAPPAGSASFPSSVLGSLQESRATE